MLLCLTSSDNTSLVSLVCLTLYLPRIHSGLYLPSKLRYLFSLLLRFPTTGQGRIRTSEILLITCITTLGIRDYLGSRGVESRIKWPNDIWVADKKICGILIENILDLDRISESIVGIGLDVNETQWPEYIPNPVSMKQLTGKTYDLEEELAALAAFIASRYTQLRTEKGRADLDTEFRKYMFRLPEEQR